MFFHYLTPIIFTQHSFPMSSTESQVYTLAAEDTDESHRWIRNLQDKREQWIRRDSALGMTDLDRQSKKKSLKPLHERPGGVLAVVGKCGST